MQVDQLVDMFDRLASIGRAARLSRISTELSESISAGDIARTAELFDEIDALPDETQHADEAQPGADEATPAQPMEQTA